MKHTETFSKATKTPWAVNPTGDIGDWSIGTEDGMYHVADAVGETNGQAKANAAYIVRCVNAHQQMREALEAALRVLISNAAYHDVIGQVNAALSAAKAS